MSGVRTQMCQWHDILSLCRPKLPNAGVGRAYQDEQRKGLGEEKGWNIKSRRKWGGGGGGGGGENKGNLRRDPGKKKAGQR